MTDHPKTPHQPPAILTPRDLRPIAGATVVMGNFDGVHRGHQALLSRARGLRPGKPVVVLSFEPHPREFFSQRSDQPVAPFRLTLADYKQHLLLRYGADDVVLLAFDEDLSQLSPQDFIQQVLVDGLGAGHVCVGEDFAFGKGRAGSVATLIEEGARHGFGVTAVAAVGDGMGEIYASSRVRTAIAAGEFMQAADILGHGWCVSAPVVKGDQRGRELGYPTANQQLSRLQLPPYGIYAVRLRIEGEYFWRQGVANLGIRPMFEVTQPLLETHIFDFTDDIYGKTIEVQPVGFIRGEAKFDSLEALIEQMKQDCLDARAVLKSGSL